MLEYSNCRLCPRKCGVDRTKGKLGYCQMPDKAYIARAAAHFGEEPIISGHFGSGAVFFSGCNLNCIFCQNASISHNCAGTAVTSAKIRQLFEELVEDGVQNINLVTPAHFLPTILPALTPKLPVPIVYNCSGYESVKVLEKLDGLIDIYLPDYKYRDKTLAKQLSHAPNYPEIAASAILEMYRQTGPYKIKDDTMVSGTMIRHLVLPGYLDNTLDVISWVSDHFTPGQILFSLLRQYTPTEATKYLKPLNRPVSDIEYEAALSWMELCGIEDGFTQDASACGVEYIPDFTAPL